MGLKRLISQLNVPLFLLILVPCIPPIFHVIQTQIQLSNSVTYKLSQSQLSKLESSKRIIFHDFEVKAEDIEVHLAKTVDPYVYVRKGELRGSIATAGLRNSYIVMACIPWLLGVLVVVFTIRINSKREQMIVNVGQKPIS